MSILKNNKANIGLFFIVTSIVGALTFSDKHTTYETVGSLYTVESDVYPSEKFDISMVQSKGVEGFYDVCGIGSTILGKGDDLYQLNCEALSKSVEFKASRDIDIEGIELVKGSVAFVARAKGTVIGMTQDTVGETDCVILRALGKLESRSV